MKLALKIIISPPHSMSTSRRQILWWANLRDDRGNHRAW
jgi:hypothetical protein